MSAELQLRGATLVLDDQALAELARQVAEQLGDHRDGPRGWIRGATAAAEYLGCRPKRVYDLVSQGLLEHRKDGSRLMFRPEWLDAVLERAG